MFDVQTHLLELAPGATDHWGSVFPQASCGAGLAECMGTEAWFDLVLGGSDTTVQPGRGHAAASRHSNGAIVGDKHCSTCGHRRTAECLGRRGGHLVEGAIRRHECNGLGDAERRSRWRQLADKTSHVGIVEPIGRLEVGARTEPSAVKMLMRTGPANESR